MFGRFSLFAIIFMVFIMFGSVNALEVTDGVHTGMSKQEVDEKLDLEFHIDKGTLKLYKRADEGNAFYAFNTNTDELVYKILFYPEDSWDKMMDKLTESKGDPVKRQSSNGVTTYFWQFDDDAGVKMSNNEEFEDVFQLWYGSVSLWNDLTEQVSGLSKFPEME